MCPVYINRIASIHAESRNEKPYFSAQEPDYKEMITNANLRRRMSRMIKMGVACGLECLKDIPSEKVEDRKSTRLNSSHDRQSRMPSSA